MLHIDVFNLVHYKYALFNQLQQKHFCFAGLVVVNEMHILHNDNFPTCNPPEENIIMVKFHNHHLLDLKAKFSEADFGIILDVSTLLFLT